MSWSIVWMVTLTAWVLYLVLVSQHSSLDAPLVLMSRRKLQWFYSVDKDWGFIKDLADLKMKPTIQKGTKYDYYLLFILVDIPTAIYIASHFSRNSHQHHLHAISEVGVYFFLGWRLLGRFLYNLRFENWKSGLHLITVFKKMKCRLWYFVNRLHVTLIWQ